MNVQLKRLLQQRLWPKYKPLLTRPQQEYKASFTLPTYATDPDTQFRQVRLPPINLAIPGRPHWSCRSRIGLFVWKCLHPLKSRRQRRAIKRLLTKTGDWIERDILTQLSEVSRAD